MKPRRKHITIDFILGYESGTFSASGRELTRDEARRIYHDLVRIGRRWVDEIDGTMLHEAHWEQL